MTCQTFSDAFITPAAPALFNAFSSALPVSRTTNRNRVTATCSAASTFEDPPKASTKR